MRLTQSICFSFFLLEYYVSAQERFEARHHHFVAEQGHLNEIPKRFQIKGDENALIEFKRYLNDIAGLSKKENISIVYKVKVEIVKPYRQWLAKKNINNKKKSKKYNVPLKKTSMKLSHFEKIMRKLADENNKKDPGHHVDDNTTKSSIPPTQPTKVPHSGKYKPIIGIMRKKFSKNVVPVRTNIITLT